MIIYSKPTFFGETPIKSNRKADGIKKTVRVAQIYFFEKFQRELFSYWLQLPTMLGIGRFVIGCISSPLKIPSNPASPDETPASPSQSTNNPTTPIRGI